MSNNSNGGKFHCPYCGGRRLQVATSTDFATSTSVTRKKVVTTVLSSNTRYWCCQDCGETFPFPQDVKAQAIAAQGEARLEKAFAKFSMIMGAVAFLLAVVVPPMAAMMASVGIFLVIAGFALIYADVPNKLKRADQIYGEYALLISQCMDD